MAQAPNQNPIVQNPANADPLAQLRDIHLPPAIDSWPPAPGWWLLALLAVLAVAAALWWAWRRWRANRYRREALHQLAALRAERGDDPEAYLTGYAALLKRVALTRYPRESVASLTGERWVKFLDRTGDTIEFSMGAGQALIAGVYDPSPAVDVDELHALGERWIRRHRPRLPEAREAQAA